MSKRRREWKEALKQDLEDETTPKKEKIKILKDETYKNVEGKLRLIATESTFQDYNSTLELEINNNNKLNNTPHQLSQKFTVDNLTPTFRNPAIFLNETKEIMKSLTPVKLFPVPYFPYHTRQDEENERHFSHLNNIQPLILSGQNHTANSLAETVSPEHAEPIRDKSNCSFTIQIEGEHDSSQDKNENNNLSEFILEINNAKFTSKKPTTGEIEERHNFNEENENNIEYYSENEAEYLKTRNCSFDAANSEINNALEKYVKMTVNAEIHNGPKNRNRDQGDTNKYKKIVMQNHILDEDQIDIFIPKDTSITVNLPSSETSNEVTGTEQNSKVKRSKRNVLYDKSYLDYMSDEDLDQLLLNEAFPSEDSSEQYYSEESSDLSNDKDKDKKDKKKKKQGKKKTKKVEIKKNNDTKDDHNISADKKPTKTAVRRETKKKKEMGESYTNDKGELVEGKSVKTNPCIGKNCGNYCGNIPEEKRQSLFSYFWKLNSHQRRKDWIAQCAVKKSIKRPTKDNNMRSCAYDYFVNEGEGRRKVCQKYLINTLDVTQRFILYTLETMTDGYAKTDERGKNGGYNKTKEEVIDHARNFIECLPKVPSHYCRKDSNRLYFPEEFRNASNLYRIYKNKCKQSGIKGMSFQVFRTWFKNSYNIGFHVPKKDKCAICSNDKNNKDKTEEEIEKIERHVKEKNESYKRFKCHQTIHGKDKSIICVSFDMQKVLNTPHGDSMMLYYSRKCAVYNFTIYESTTRKGYCNIWTETDAHRGANEICTCLNNYIEELDSRGSVKTLLLYCDSCYGQNKNKSVLSMIRFALSRCKIIKTIQINYLIPGHTYMPVDSVHATIETKIRKSIIWAPSQWPTIMEFARQDPEPYKVNVLKGKDFVGFDDVVNATFKKHQKFAVSKLNIATFKKKEPDVMYIKNSMLPDAETMKIPLLPLKNTVSLKEKLYPTQLGISAKKHKDLINLVDKNIIPSRFATEYKNLKCNNKVKDSLVDTDEEDVIEMQDDDI